MPSGMGVTNPKFAKSVRKPKKVKHCTIPEWRQTKEISPVELQVRYRGHTVLNCRNQRDVPNMKFGGVY